ncbi:hypothetical protein DL96DRAFT_1681383 [Flagelloscypha sp. PMI_526]|nr:hypothetical protein DL96DRAFT_1681383 [Flagelloscypha sp. PMI_526]
MSSIGSERAALEIEIASLETRLLALRFQLNSLSHVNRLPSDLLLEIISLARGITSSNFGWVRGITDVCSHWRTITLNHRELWATVFLSPHHVKIQTPIFTLLNRSDGYPLILHAPNSWVLEGKIAERFNIHPHTLRGLRVDTCDRLEHIYQFFCCDDGIPMPLLQNIQIDASSDRFQTRPSFMACLSKQCPRLRSIRIPSLFFAQKDLDTISARRLTDLSLVSGNFGWRSPAMDAIIKPYDILAALSHYRDLRSLNLHGIYIDYYEDSSSAGELTLPMLVSLTLDHASIRSVVNLLRSITTNAAVEISCLRLLAGTRDGMTGTETFELSRLMRELVEVMLRYCKSQGTKLFLCHTRNIETEDTFELRLSDNNCDFFSLTILSPDDFPAPMNRFVFNTLLSHLDPKSFSQVCFVGDALSVADLPFFSGCSATKVSVHPWESIQGLSLSTPLGVSTIPFPLLKTLEVLGPKSWDHILGLTSTLWWRHRRGLPLPSLHWRKYDDSELELTSRILLTRITSALVLIQDTGETELITCPDDEVLSKWGPIGNYPELDEETDSGWEATDEGEDKEGLIRDEYGSWILQPEEPLLEEDDSGDDYIPTDSEEDHELGEKSN